jgi:hypothetical protein
MLQRPDKDEHLFRPYQPDPRLRTTAPPLVKVGAERAATWGRAQHGNNLDKRLPSKELLQTGKTGKLAARRILKINGRTAVAAAGRDRSSTTTPTKTFGQACT